MFSRIKLYVLILFISIITTIFIFSENLYIPEIQNDNNTVIKYAHSHSPIPTTPSPTPATPSPTPTTPSPTPTTPSPTPTTPSPTPTTPSPTPTTPSSTPSQSEPVSSNTEVISILESLTVNISHKGLNNYIFSDNINNLFINIIPPYNKDLYTILRLFLNLVGSKIQQNIVVAGNCTEREYFEKSIADPFETVFKEWIYQAYTLNDNETINLYQNHARCDSASSFNQTEFGILTHLKMVEISNGKRLFRKYIQPVQHTEFEDIDGCTERKTIVKQIHPRGMFGSLHYVADSLERGIHLNRMVVLDDSRFSYVDRNWEDLFLPIASCRDFSKPQGNTQLKLNFIANPLDSHIAEQPVLYVDGNFHQFDSGHPGEGIYPIVEMKDWREYRSYTMGYITRPSYNLREYMKEMRKTLFGEYLVDGRPPRCIAVHVRHGDLKTIHYYSAPTVLQFADKIKEMYNHYNGEVKHIMLMSDKQEPIDELTKIQDPPYVWHYLNTSRIGDADIALNLEHGNDKDKRLKFGLETYAEAAIASECEYFIGAFTSNVATFIAEMMYFRNSSTKDSWSSLDGKGFHSYT